MANLVTTTKSIDLGEVQSETQVKSSEMFNIPVPSLDSNEAIILDLFGNSRNTTVSGIVTGNTAQLNTFITDVEGEKIPFQPGITFESSLTTFADKLVFIKSFSWTYVAGSPSKVAYELELIEGASAA